MKFRGDKPRKRTGDELFEDAPDTSRKRRYIPKVWHPGAAFKERELTLNRPL